MSSLDLDDIHHVSSYDDFIPLPFSTVATLTRDVDDHEFIEGFHMPLGLGPVVIQNRLASHANARVEHAWDLKMPITSSAASWYQTHPETAEFATNRGRDMPIELLRMVVKHAIADEEKRLFIYSVPPAIEPIMLTSLSLICRSFFRLCQPLLYTRIFVKETQLETFIDTLRTPQCLMRPHIKYLNLCSSKHVDPGNLSILSKLLSDTLTHLTIDWKELSVERAEHCIPYSRIMAGALATFPALTYLKLWHYSFSSFQDLLRLFGSLHSLAEAYLEDVTWRHSQVLAPSYRLSKIAEITCIDCPPIWPFVLCCSWSRSFTGSADGIFTGLSRAEASIAARICENTWLGDAAYRALRFEGTCYPCIYVATVETFDLGKKPYLQIYIQQANGAAPVPRLASIRWISFSTGNYVSMLPSKETSLALFKSWESVEKVNELLSQLPNLEKVVLETEDVVDSEEIASLLSNVTDKIHYWSANDAENYAREVHRKGVPFRDQLPVSPWRWKKVQREM